MTSRYAVFGQPIAHTLSPRIHAMFAAQRGIAIDYRAIEAGHAEFACALDAFAGEGGQGANVTLPLKLDALALCRKLTERARRCGSVNTLTRDGEGWRGDSTDGAGMLRDLRERHGFDPRGRSVLLLGAGGAARAVAFELAGTGAGALVIANRTRERAGLLAAELGANVQACGWDETETQGEFDLVVNATSTGHSGTFEQSRAIVSPHTVCYELSYGAAGRPFVTWAFAAGAMRVSDGLGMLVEQAADSFALWHGERPATEPVHAELRAALASESADGGSQ